MKQQHRGGMTLLEIMVVVAIVGLMSSLAVAGIGSATRMGKVNGSASLIAQVMNTARARAVSERCTYVVQINGPGYAPSAAPADVLRRAATVLLYRKNDCNSVIGAYEPGLALPVRDRLVAEYSLAEFGMTQFTSPPMVGMTNIDTGSISFAWRGTGARLLSADPDADGTSTLVASGATYTLTVRPRALADGPQRDINIPNAGSVSLP